jgi:hypothetical protein
MNQRTGVIDVELIDEGISLVHAVMGAARTQTVWLVYKTYYGLTCAPEDQATFKRRHLIATVRPIRDNIVDVTYEHDQRVERLYV